MSSEEPRITIKKINDEEIKPMRVAGGSDARPVRGEELFPEVYANVFLCAKKRSGKTCVIQKILKKCCGPSTVVLAFCSTVNKDANWLAIRKWCGERSIRFEGFPSIKEAKVDTIDAFLHRLEQEAEEVPLDDGEDDGPRRTRGGKVAPRVLPFFQGQGGGREEEESDEEWDDGEEEDADDLNLFRQKAPSKEETRMFRGRNRTSLKPKEKFKAPEYILIMDDLSNELKLPSVVSLLKKNRHYKLKCIISSQWIHDLKPEEIKQLDYLLLFKGMTDEKLQKVLQDVDLSIDFPTLKKIYDDAVATPYSFLYIDCRQDQFRKCFDRLYCIEA